MKYTHKSLCADLLALNAKLAKAARALGQAAALVRRAYAKAAAIEGGAA